MLSLIGQAAYICLLLMFVPIPFATDRLIRRVPWFTYAIIAINFIAYVIFVVPEMNNAEGNPVFAKWGLEPRSPNLVDLFTYLFLHVSTAHLFWNCAFLLLFGPSVEDALGHFPFLALYFAGGIIAGMLHIAIVLLFAQNSAAAFAPLVGSSGAISAVIGLYAVRYYRSRLHIVWGCAWFLQLRTAYFELPAIFGLSLWLLQNLCGALIALVQPDRNGIAYWAHIGGFLFGMAVADITGMLAEGVREYLFADALNSQNLGEGGVKAAVAKLHTLLHRSPDDDEVKSALAKLASESNSTDSLFVREVVSEAYALLLGRSFAASDAYRSREWMSAFNELAADDVVNRTVLLQLAASAAKFGDVIFADRLYSRLIDRFPGSQECHHAIVAGAALRLEVYESPLPAVRLLTDSLIESRKPSHSAAKAVMSGWRRLLNMIGLGE